MSEKEYIKNPEVKEKYSGSYGIVIKPDMYTGEKSIELAHSLTPDAEYKVSLPHITLYHGNVSDLPHQEIEKILNAAREILKDDIQELRTIDVFGGKFVFWDVVPNKIMRQAHDAALGLSEFLDQTKLARALQEGLHLTQEQKLNMQNYGHPLVGNLYRPHITLAYDAKGIVLPKDVTGYDWQMKVDSIHFAEIGNYGSVAKVIL